VIKMRRNSMTESPAPNGRFCVSGGVARSNDSVISEVSLPPEPQRAATHAKPLGR